MCGQCVEETYIPRILTQTRSRKVDLENELYNIYYLQETESLVKSLNKIARAVRAEEPEKDLLEFFDPQVILSRLVEVLIQNGFDSQEYTTCLKNRLVRQAIAGECRKEGKSLKVLEKFSLFPETIYPLHLKPLDNPPGEAGHLFPMTPFSALYKPTTYLKREEWEDFISQEGLTAHCQEVLSFYISWWLKGKGLKKNDLDQVMEETGVLDALMGISNDERVFFDAAFRVLFFSLVFLTKKGMERDYVKEIALNSPWGASSLEALDLWLQRKAAYSLFVKAGPAFFLSYRDQIRPALLDYLVLKFNLPPFHSTN